MPTLTALECLIDALRQPAAGQGCEFGDLLASACVDHLEKQQASFWENPLDVTIRKENPKQCCHCPRDVVVVQSMFPFIGSVDVIQEELRNLVQHLENWKRPSKYQFQGANL